ncbi:MAG: hypothetical protein Q7U87_00395, partial [bacterium]|nr:hypothetical protein [bacterium]
SSGRPQGERLVIEKVSIPFRADNEPCTVVIVISACQAEEFTMGKMLVHINSTPSSPSLAKRRGWG